MEINAARAPYQGPKKKATGRVTTRPIVSPLMDATGMRFSSNPARPAATATARGRCAKVRTDRANIEVDTPGRRAEAVPGSASQDRPSRQQDAGRDARVTG